jgi:hypothetical protein
MAPIVPHFTPTEKNKGVFVINKYAQLIRTPIQAVLIATEA